MYLSLKDRPGDAGTAQRLKSVAVPATVVMLGAVSLLTDVSSEMVNAVLPMYLTAKVGLGLLAYGFIDGLYQGVSAFLRIAGGYLGDRVRRPKWVAAAGYGASAVSRILMLPATGLLTITGVVTMDRLGKGLRTAPRDSMIAESTEPDQLGRSFGVHRAMDTVGAAIGPLVAFGILLWVPDSYNSIFVVSFAFAVVGVAVLLLLVPDVRTRAVTGAKSRAAILKAAVAPGLRKPLVAFGLLSLLTVGDGFLYLSLQQRDQLAVEVFPLLYVGTNVAFLALAVPLGRLADRIGRGRVLVGGHVALLIAYLCAGGPLIGPAMTISTLVFLGVFYASTDGVLSALVSRIAPAEGRGSAIAAAQTVVVLARFGASVAFGGLWVLIGPEKGLLAAAVALLAMLPVAAWLLRERRPATQQLGATQ
ncbi:MFS transporter [Actinoplanes sp. KI2]|uniref:MFS transporter n=1 Tax=Actinoplanes sp. KI2 TaxID=2983315 RepID=UPI0021D5CE2A|nr:MFS transporter [Actinoplanes sp. KI2]MCU7726420.1 MFS transporter [Actinoplanes sp. KI2]